MRAPRAISTGWAARDRHPSAAAFLADFDLACRLHAVPQHAAAVVAIAKRFVWFAIERAGA